MGRLHDAMAADLKLRGLAPDTQRQYLARVRHLAAFYRRPPDRLTAQEVRRFLLDVVEKRKLSVASLASYVAAFRFFYGVTCKRPGFIASIPWPKRPRHLPDILTREEVLRVLAAVTSLKCRTILMVAYGAGLRISEACTLSPRDIDRARGVIHVRGGKGDKDRYVMLSPRLLAFLETYWHAVRPRGRHLFPGRPAGWKRPISTKAVQRALSKALAKLGLRKHVTPHSMRHAFATHLLEAGTDLRVLQRLLGHSRIETTARYTQVTRELVSRVTSPLDLPPPPPATT
jgi:integrase/recombinase XerD